MSIGQRYSTPDVQQLKEQTLQLFTIPLLRTGRVLFMGRKMKGALPADAPPPLVAQLDTTLAAAAAFRLIETAWDNRDTSTARGSALEVDRDADALLAQIAAVCQALEPLGADTPMGAAAAAFLERFFPRGVAKVTQLNYEEEIEYIDDLLAAVSAGEPAAWVAALPIGDFIDRLRALAPLYRAELEKDRAQLTHAEVVDGRRALRASLWDLVAHVWVFSPDAATRDALLEPLTFQIAAHRAKLRLRRNGSSDVDPQTGEEVIIEAPTEDD